MSQTKQWASDLGAAARSHSGYPSQGAGGSTRFYVGYLSPYQYTSYLRFALDWTGVGKIKSAILSIYTDDGLGGFDSSMTNTPYAAIQRCTSAFTKHSSNPGWIAGDYNAPNRTTANQVVFHPSRAVNAVNDIDITAMVEDWAPSTVKKRDGTGGGKAANYGVGIIGDFTPTDRWAAFSDAYSDTSYRPSITLTYEYGLVLPDVPGSMAPTGSNPAASAFTGTFSSVKDSAILAFSEVEVFTAAATASGQSVTGGSVVFTSRQAASDTEILNSVFNLVPSALTLTRNVDYKWRARVTDQEGQVSLWSDLVTFSVTNDPPTAPTITPSGSTYASLSGVQFRTGTFNDPDGGNTLLAYQYQLSAYPSGDIGWLDDSEIRWNTGKVYTPAGATETGAPYGGASLSAGTYYWRARVWDNHQGVSAWTYATITVSADFVVSAGSVTTLPQIRPQAAQRTVIRDMYQANGVTRTTGRGPGRVVAILEDAENVGASKMYNSPGDLHFTVPVGHPQLSVLEPKQTHYSVQLRQGDGWREVYAGLLWDYDATNTDIVFYGVDYLSLIDYTLDETYDPSNPNKPAESGGSKYVSTGKNSIAYIVRDQLLRATQLPNSPVGFIAVPALVDMATMTETLVVYSTYQPTLSFVAGLIDSHRAGTGKRTRISVELQTNGSYKFKIEDNPGTQRDNMRMRYGELVQGYRVVPFGKSWASRMAVIGRGKDGVRIMYKTLTAPGIDEAVWGHFAQAAFIDGVNDENDLSRRVQQLATASGKLGSQMGIGLRSGVLQPFDGYDICDSFPVDINYGNVNTANFGSGYWDCMGVTWQVDAKTGHQITTLTLNPRQDDTPPSNDLVTLSPISPQQEWQVGWANPDPTVETAMKFVNQTTGIVFYRQDDGSYSSGTPGDTTTPPTPSDIIAPGAVLVDKLETAIRPVLSYMSSFCFGGGISTNCTFVGGLLQILGTGVTRPAFTPMGYGGGTMWITDSLTQEIIYGTDGHYGTPGAVTWSDTGGNKAGDGRGLDGFGNWAMGVPPPGPSGVAPLTLYTGRIYYIFAASNMPLYTTGLTTIWRFPGGYSVPAAADIYIRQHPTGAANNDGLPAYTPLLIGSFEVAPSDATSVVAQRNISWLDTPDGTIDGSNTDFQLLYNPTPPTALMLYVNGVLQRQGAGNDYTLALGAGSWGGAVVTFLAGNIPQTGDILLATYPY